MQYKLISKENSKGLLVFFLGWSCTPESVVKFNPSGWDLLLLYDYRDLSLPDDFQKIIFSYEKHALIAHSFGVWVAGHFMSEMPSFSSSVAVCGSLLPVDDKYGIPTRIFDFTLRAIQKEGIVKFNEKMCGDERKDFVSSTVPFDDQYAELVALGDFFKKYPLSFEDAQKWSAAVVCSKDEIFPPMNIASFWGENSVEIMAFRNKPHFPFNGNFCQVIAHLLN